MEGAWRTLGRRLADARRLPAKPPDGVGEYACTRVSSTAVAPASLLISRMQAASPKPPLAAALGEYGRLIRTNFLLAYLADAPLRRRIGAQLNKGETMHALRQHVTFGQCQQLPADEDDHRRHALCLKVVTNAVLERVSAMPKSVTLSTPSSENMRFCGLMCGAARLRRGVLRDR